MAISSKFPIINLSTVRPNGLGVQIDDDVYETIPPSHWGAEHTYNARQYLNEIQKFEQKMENQDEIVSQDDVNAYKYNLRQFAHIILPDAPHEKVDSLPDAELGRLVQYFLSALRKVREIPSLEPNGKVPT